MSEGRHELLGVTLLVNGDTTTVRVGDSTIDVPTTSLSMGGGRLFIEVAGDLAATFRKEQVNVVAHHPEPSLHQLHAAIAALDPMAVTALMAQESSWSSMDDPMGLVAIRAVARAVQGERAEPPADPLETL